MKILRPYQLECADSLLSSDGHALSVLPTAAGKTEIFIEILRRTSHLRSLVILNKLHLLDQTERRISKDLQIRVAVYCGSRRKDTFRSPITIGSIQSILKAKHLSFDHIFLDEVHALDFKNPTARYCQLIQAFPTARVFGFTATPYRENGYIFGEGCLFSRINYQKNLKEMISDGWLCPPVLRGSSHSFDTSRLKIVMGDYDQGQLDSLVSDEGKMKSQVWDALLRSRGRKKVIWFCANIKHAEKVRESIGSDAAILHSGLSKEEQALNKENFETRDEFRHMVFVTIISEGYDYAPIDCVVILRPTRSPVRYVQTVGRALRLSPGKTDALILDYGEVIKNLGPLDSPRIIDRSMPFKEKKELFAFSAMKQCPQCFLMIDVMAVNCPECDYEFVEKKLTKKPESIINLLSDSGPVGLEHIVKISKVSFFHHVSRAGKDCVRVVYFPENIMEPNLLEYLVKEGWYSFKLKERFDYFKMTELTVLPYFIERSLTLKYQKELYGIKVISIESREGHRNADSYLA